MRLTDIAKRLECVSDEQRFGNIVSVVAPYRTGVSLESCDGGPYAAEAMVLGYVRGRNTYARRGRRLVVSSDRYVHVLVDGESEPRYIHSERVK